MLKSIICLLKNIKKFQSVGMGFYITGLEGVKISRCLRRLICKSSWHRAWMSGLNGRFSDMYGEHGICGYFDKNNQTLIHVNKSDDGKNLMWSKKHGTKA